MATHRPIAHRTFSVLLAVLLVGSVVAPIAAQPAAAQEDNGWVDGSFEGTCDSPAQYVLFVSCPHADFAQPDKIVSADPAVMHSIGTSEWESQKSQYQLHSNYLQDTETIASLEARHAIATAYQNNKTVDQAYSDAIDAIKDYYSVHQKSHLELLSKSARQYTYIERTATNNTDVQYITSPWYGTSAQLNSTGASSFTLDSGPSVTTNVVNSSAELVNGSTHQITTAEMDITYHPDSYPDESYTGSVEMNPAGENWRYLSQSDQLGVDVQDDAKYTYAIYLDGSYEIGQPNVGDVTEDGLPANTVMDLREWYDRWNQMEQQSENLRLNYDRAFVEDLYAEMDAGNIEPSEIRGAEGQARFLSGDANATEDRFKLSVMSMLGTNSPDMNETSKMIVQYDGYTTENYTTVNGERTVDYEDAVNETYEGILYSGEVPEDGFTAGETYNTENLSGTVSMFDAPSGEYIPFVQGEFTVDSMYDRGGNEMQSTTWDEPEYGTYNATEFVQYMDSVEENQFAEEEEDTTTNVNIGLPNIGLPEGGSTIVGLAIIGAVVLVVVGLVTNMIPGMGD